MASFLLNLPCPHTVNLTENNTKTTLINIFRRNCLPHKHVTILDVKSLTSSTKPCGYEVICRHNFEPEDKMMLNETEGELLLGREDLVHHLIQAQKAELKINIKEYVVEFYDEYTFKTCFYLDCKCQPPTFCALDKMMKVMAIG